MAKEKKIILIGGAPTVGKTTVARELSKKLGIPWISTDTIREMMRGVVKKEDYPKLLDAEKYTAEEYLNKFSAEEIVKKQNEESEEVWKGVKALINTDYNWNSFIVEGVAILPHLVAKDFSSKKKIKAIFLIDEDSDRIRDVVFTRGLWNDARTYPDDVKEKEVEWAKLSSSWFKKEAEKYNYPCLEVKKGDDESDLIAKKLGL